LSLSHFLTPTEEPHRKILKVPQKALNGLTYVVGQPRRPGDTVTLVGRDGREELTALEQAQRIGTINYEFITRINPLIHKIVV